MAKTRKVWTIDKILAEMRKDRAVRRAIARRSFKFFFLFYFSHYREFPAAPFHDEIFDLAQNDTHSMLVISAFRNSGKSTILSLAYVAWSIINGRNKYILIVSENQHKSQTLLEHIREEFEKEGMLRHDLGPFKEDRSAWNTVSLTVKNYGAKISAHSVEQSLRSLRHGNRRPDLFILDDCESSDSVRTQESRDKLSRWLSGDVIPAGHSNSKVIVIGSMLHPDSLIPRLQRGIDEGKIDGIYRMYPIIDDDGNPTWAARYPDAASIEREKKRGIDEREWMVEFLLKPITDEDQIIKSEHIHYYDHPPTLDDSVHTAIDLAFGEGEGHDFTAMVSCVVTWEEDKWYIDILPDPVNVQLKGPDVVERIVAESLKLGNGLPTPVYIEDVQAQRFVIDAVRAKGIPAEGVSPGGNDKRARLNSVSEIFKSRVRWPRKGCEKVLNQVLYFGVERHDDLVDALVYLIMKVFVQMEHGRVTVPSLDASVAKCMTRSEEEEWADKGQRLLQEAQRGRDSFLWHQYRQWQDEDNRRRPEYEEERRRLSIEMQRSFRRHI